MKKKILTFILTIIILLIISMVLTIWLPLFKSLRIVFSVVYIMFLPGYILTYLFFDRSNIDLTERITFSIGLSIAIIPLLIFLLSKLGMVINDISICLTILGLIVLGIIGIIIKLLIRKRNN